MPTRPIELSDFNLDLDHFFATHSLRLIVARIDSCQEIEEEGMDLKPRSSLKGLMSNRNKGKSSKDAPKEQALANLPPPTDPRLPANPHLRRKRLVDELEEGEVGPQKAK